MPDKRTVPHVADQLGHLLGGTDARGHVEFAFTAADLELREQLFDQIDREEALFHRRIRPAVERLVEIQRRGQPVLVVSTKVSR